MDVNTILNFMNVFIVFVGPLGINTQRLCPGAVGCNTGYRCATAGRGRGRSAPGCGTNNDAMVLDQSFQGTGPGSMMNRRGFLRQPGLSYSGYPRTRFGQYSRMMDRNRFGQQFAAGRGSRLPYGMMNGANPYFSGGLTGGLAGGILPVVRPSVVTDQSKQTDTTINVKNDNTNIHDQSGTGGVQVIQEAGTGAQQPGLLDGGLPGVFPPLGGAPGLFPPVLGLPGGLPPVGIMPGGLPPIGIMPGGLPPIGGMPGGLPPVGIMPGGLPPVGIMPGGLPPVGIMPGGFQPGVLPTIGSGIIPVGRPIIVNDKSTKSHQDINIANTNDNVHDQSGKGGVDVIQVSGTGEQQPGMLGGGLTGALPTFGGLPGMFPTVGGGLPGAMPTFGRLPGMLPTGGGLPGILATGGGLPGMLSTGGGLPGVLPPIGGMPGGFPPVGRMPGGFPQIGGMPGGLPQIGGMPGGLPPIGGMPGGFPQVGRMPGGLSPIGGMPGGFPPVGRMPGGLPPIGDMPGGLPPIGGMPAVFPPVGIMPGGLPPIGIMPGGFQPGVLPTIGSGIIPVGRPSIVNDKSTKSHQDINIANTNDNVHDQSGKGGVDVIQVSGTGEQQPGMLGGGLTGALPTFGRLPGMLPTGGGLPGMMPTGGVLPGMLPIGGGLPGMLPTGVGLTGMMPTGGGLTGMMPTGGVLTGMMPTGVGLTGMMPTGVGLPGMLPTVGSIGPGVFPNIGGGLPNLVPMGPGVIGTGVIPVTGPSVVNDQSESTNLKLNINNDNKNVHDQSNSGGVQVSQSSRAGTLQPGLLPHQPGYLPMQPVLLPHGLPQYQQDPYPNRGQNVFSQGQRGYPRVM